MPEATINREPRPAIRKAPAKPIAAGNSAIAGIRFALLAVISLGFVILADWLFWNQPQGWTIGGYGLLLTGTILVWERTLPYGRAGLLVTSAVVVLCMQCLEEPNRLTVACGLLGLASLALLVRDGWSTSAVVWMWRWALLAERGWLTLFKDIAASYRSQLGGRRLERWGFRVIRHWSIPVFLGAVFLALFAVANPVVSSWLQHAWQDLHSLLRHLVERSPSGWRLLMWLLVGLVVWALLRFRSGVHAPPWGNGAATDVAPTDSPSPASVVRCLVLFNTLFALQTAMDIYYLWCGGELPNGLTHAQYAHRGAYPLLVAAILAAVFTLAAFPAGSREHKARVARRLVYVWLIQNMLLVVSAAWRLRLYVEAYTLTRWRVAAAIWMLLVLCGVLWILLRIISGRSNHWLVNVNTATALVVLHLFSFGNFDGWIASFNVSHCREMEGAGPAIDLAYLESLGPDTLPALLQLADKVQDSPYASAVRETIGRLKMELSADLSSWRGWTWRRQRHLQLDFPETMPGFGG